MNFQPTTQKSENFTLMGYFFYMRFELKKYRGVTFHDTEEWCKIWINPDLVVSKMAWGIGCTFIRARKSLKIVHLWALFVQSICFRKFQKNYVSWHWRVSQNLIGNWLAAWKMTWGIWLIFMWAVEENLHFDWILLSKTHKYLDEKVQKS